VSGASIFSWWNVPYLVAVGVASAFAMLQASGLLGLLASGDGAAGGDADGEADGGDTDGEADGDAGEGDHAGLGHTLLAAVGVGAVPLSIVWQTFAVAFGVTGLVVHLLAGVASLQALAWSAPLATAAAFVATRTVTRPLARALASKAAQATTRDELVGATGVVISTRVDARFGEVRLRDKTGHVLRLVVRTHDEPIVEGREVVVVDHDHAQGHLWVAALSDPEP